jgi:hypothetical protein
MSETKYLLRKSTGDQPAETEQEVKDWFQKGQCKPADYLFDFSAGKWMRVGDHPALADLFGPKPAKAPEKRIIYYIAPGATPLPQGPFTTKELQGRIQSRELCEASWVFVEGDKEWRQVRAVKALMDLLGPLPADVPAPPASEPPVAPAAAAPVSSAPADDGSDLVIEFGSGTGATKAPEEAAPEAHVEHEEATMALSTLGLSSLQVDHSAPEAAPEPAPASAPSAGGGGGMELADTNEPSLVLDLGDGSAGAPPSAPPSAPPKAPAHAPAAAGGPPKPPPAKPAVPPGLPGAAKAAPPGPPPGMKPAAPPVAPPKPMAPPVAAKPPATPSAPAPAAAAEPEKDTGSFDGITAQISTDPIWLVKQAASETVSGPFRFLDVVKFLNEGRLNKNDKISKAGTNRFVKIQQQYEFNVKFAVETVVENGVERQKILIKRRHPRVAYFTEVQVLTKQGMLAANCVNISAGGILMENAKTDFHLGDILEIKLLPGLINRSVSCKALVIGKIPKMPPAYALKFEDLKQEDKEAIEHYVQETLKRES